MMNLKRRVTLVIMIVLCITDMIRKIEIIRIDEVKSITDNSTKRNWKRCKYKHR